MKLFKNNRGIAHLAILLVFAAVAIGFVGYTSWNAWQAEKDNATTTTQTTPAEQPAVEVEEEADPYVGWKKYTSKYGFSIRFPKDWSIGTSTIDNYPTLQSAESVSGNHFEITYYPTQNTAQEGPAAFAGGNVKLEVYVFAVGSNNFDTWFGTISAGTYEGAKNVRSTDIKVGKYEGKRLLADARAYGGTSNTTYTLINNIGFVIHIYSEDGANPPKTAYRVIDTLGL